jgi:[ribosomal protein S18]-alanine N-acetyltransferase
VGVAVRVRVAAGRDLDAIVAIERASFADPWSRGAFAEVLGHRRRHFEVACDAGGAVAGYVVAWFVEDEGEIGNLAVAPPERRAGIAAALLGRTLDAARAAGVRTLHLEVRESNAAARALYARHGFTEEGRRRAYYRLPVEDALRLRLALPAGG